MYESQINQLASINAKKSLNYDSENQSKRQKVEEETDEEAAKRRVKLNKEKEDASCATPPLQPSNEGFEVPITSMPHSKSLSNNRSREAYENTTESKSQSQNVNF